MRSGSLEWWLGYIQIAVRGDHIEELMNRMLQERLRFWQMERKADTVCMYVRLPHFYRLRPLLKQTGCRVHVTERQGFPFMLERLSSRKVFMGGIVFFILGLYVLSNLVWRVDISGNDRLSKDEIRQAAQEAGVYPLQWKFRLPDPDQIAYALTRKLPDATWIGVEINGTTVQIKIVESTIPEAQQLKSPRHVVATHDAVITDIQAVRGVPQVRVNQRVRKGDILISGILGDEEHSEVVVAEGDVKGLVWYEYDMAVPLTQRHHVYTGNVRERDYLLFGTRALKVKGYGDTGFADQDLIQEVHKIRWRNWELPFGWMNEKVLEIRMEETALEVKEAKEIALQQARADLLLKAGEDAEIREQNVLHERSESGKVYMKAHFEVNQTIAGEQVIVQGE
ncbi:sporulation protein YqfD [Xylanibacillus composti]|nr:sporulation protein YqfD [Xylanibacillus composti]